MWTNRRSRAPGVAGDIIHRGLAEALDSDGHLLLCMANGEVRTLTAGEVTLGG